MRNLLIVALFSITVIAWAGTGLLTNSGFSETAGNPRQPTGWTATGATALDRFQWSEVDGVNSNDSMAVVGSRGAESDAITQSVSCEKNVEYVLTAAVKGSTGCRSVVEVLDVATQRVMAQLQADTAGVWHQRIRRFNSKSAAKLTVRISARGRTGAAAVDAVQLYRTADAPDELASGNRFTPPGPNLAKGKKYTVSPRPNYGYCTDPGDKTQLTDGTYTAGYFWTQKSTVGWTRGSPVTITIDLGRIEPIAGASYNTAAGVAGVEWPGVVIVLVSDDSRAWYKAGELVRETLSRAAPPTDGYHVHRFASGTWKAKGRYVRFLVGQTPYCFVDEIEVYKGKPAWLALARSGPAFKNDKAIREQLFVRPQIATAAAWRLRADLDQITEALRKAAIPEGDRSRLSVRAADLRKQIEAMPEPPVELRTILPLNDLHRQILALHAPLLRARGYSAITAWKSNRWAPLGMLDAPAAPPVSTPKLEIDMARGEVRADAFNLTNPTDKPLTAEITIQGLPGGDPPAYVSVRDVLFTDTSSRTPVAAALPEAERTATAWHVAIPAGCTKQVWLSFQRPPSTLPAGVADAVLTATSAGGAAIRLPVRFHLYDIDFPQQTTLALGGWDYTNGSASYYHAPGNLKSLLALFQDQNVNTPWATAGVAPRDMQFAKDGALINPQALDFHAWDEWVKRWDFARNYFVFLSVGSSFQGEKMDTPRFRRMVGDWFEAWAEHIRAQQITPERVGVLLVDEPRAPSQDAVIVAWAKAIRAAGTGIRIFEDPTYRDPTKGVPEMFQLADILCPNTPMMVSQGEKFRQFYAGQRRNGRTLWLYSCSGPAKLLDPCAYHRGQMWWALRTGATGCFYWALGCGGGIGDSWRAYAQPGTEYAPFFVGQKEVVDGKHMEAIREGVEDYEYFVMLRNRVQALKQQGVNSKALAAAARLLSEGPRRVTDTITPKAMTWSAKVNHDIMDRVRVEALNLLDQLK